MKFASKKKITNYLSELIQIGVVYNVPQLVEQHLDADKRLHTVSPIQTVHTVGANELRLQLYYRVGKVGRGIFILIVIIVRPSAEEHAHGGLASVVLLNFIS